MTDRPTCYVSVSTANRHNNRPMTVYKVVRCIVQYGVSYRAVYRTLIHYFQAYTVEWADAHENVDKKY